MNKNTIYIYILAILVMKTLQNKQRDYSIIKLVGTVDKYESFNKLKFRLYAFKHITNGKSEAYKKMLISN